ncbi:hypothetical protein DRO69_01835 [Candidatus Bathyarchaeota archaeon]|nr:MAG: hypothetical protein DRO69_01835 [Candidatus Bathyarchaeota archaeon]
MKGGKKHKIRKEKKKERHIALAVTVGVLIILISIFGFFINSTPTQSSINETTSFPLQRKAAIVDQLSLTVPNQTFIETATSILKQAGYVVDYYPGEKVTVEFYRMLPTHGYKLIILRVHSTATEAQGTESPVTLFTSERFNSTKYIYEQLTNQLWGVTYSREEKEIIYFGITPLFVTRSMKDRFHDTIIIMMGCEGLDNPLMANAFVRKGAKVFISWNDVVLASHTDQATTRLLQHFLIEKRTLEESMIETFKDVGFDPVYKSQLIYYPLEVGDQTIEDIT